MTAQDVYNIAKALPKEEYVHLYVMLQGSLEPNATRKNNRKQPLISDLQAQKYLLKNLFNEESVKTRLKRSKS